MSDIPESKKAQVNLSLLIFGQLEREKGFEPSTPTLAREKLNCFNNLIRYAKIIESIHQCETGWVLYFELH
ncbi:hypothetical protein [Phyllobacterium ifriqiyense]|uniref:hypothetical protein n=1 Tax=Phyllobacterium ifriqiyense TaxID=314238 RepID=UPI003392C536